MSYLGLAHKIPLQFLCKRSKHFFFNGNIKKNQHVNMFQQAFFLPSVISQYLEHCISLFCLQVVKYFPISSKPFLRLLYLLTISAWCLSLGNNIFWGKTTLEVFWFITWLALGVRKVVYIFTSSFFPSILPSFLSFPL